MYPWDMISTHNDVYNEEMRRKEKAFIRARAKRVPIDHTRVNPLFALIGAIRERWNRAERASRAPSSATNPDPAHT